MICVWCKIDKPLSDFHWLCKKHHIEFHNQLKIKSREQI